MKETFGKKLKVAVLAWLTVIFVAAALAPRFISQTIFVGNRNMFGEHFPRLVWLWANLDGNHYLSIARDGYYRFEFGFFPLYPLLIRLLSTLTGKPFLLSALLISYAAFFGFLAMFLKLLRLDFGKHQAMDVVMWFLAFPTSFYLISVYNDSLFLLLVTSVFYFARKKKWWISGIMGFFASLTRVTGLALFPALLLEWYLERGKRRNLLPTMLVPLGTASYLWYLNGIGGGVNLISQSMEVWGQSRFIFLVQTMWRYLKIFVTHRAINRVFLIAGIEFTSVLLSMFLIVRGKKLIRPSYLVYLVSLLLIPLSSGTFQGMPRYFLHAFPLVIILALLIGKKWYRNPLMALSLILQIVLVAYFSQGHFVS